MDEEGFITMQVSQKAMDEDFLTYDSVTSLKRIRCRVLALNGGKHIQMGPEIDVHPTNYQERRQ